MCICKYVDMYICIYVYMCICIYACIRLYMYIYIYVKHVWGGLQPSSIDLSWQCEHDWDARTGFSFRRGAPVDFSVDYPLEQSEGWGTAEWQWQEGR